MRHLYVRVMAGILALTAASAAFAGSDMDTAIKAGAKRLTASEIAGRLAGKTVTFEIAASGDQWLVYYDGINGTRMRKIGGDKVFEGFYATSAADHVCLGNNSDKAMILRCVHVVDVDGVMHKFELDGSLRGTIIEAQDGNLT